jgi:DNA-binding IscR family transcriptional regulator
VTSVRGPQGGFSLAQPASETNLLDVERLADLTLVDLDLSNLLQDTT